MTSVTSRKAGTCSELHVDEVILHDGEFSVEQRVEHVLAVKVLVPESNQAQRAITQCRNYMYLGSFLLPFILGVHGDRSVTKHGLNTRRRHNNLLICAQKTVKVKLNIQHIPAFNISILHV